MEGDSTENLEIVQEGHPENDEGCDLGGLDLLTEALEKSIVLYKKEGNAENGDFGWDLDLPPNADTPNAANPSCKLHQWFGQSMPFGVDNKSGHECVMSYTTIMGLCEDTFGVIAADSRQTLEEGKTDDRAVKSVRVTPHIGMVGSGNGLIFQLVKNSISAFSFKNAMAVTMKDVVDCIVTMTISCVEEAKKLDPKVTDHTVFYIVVGKMKETFEMYTISNSSTHDSGCVIAARATTRIMIGGSGAMALSTYQEKNPLRKFVGEFEAVDYCFKCMKSALLKDNVSSGGDIQIFLINNEGLIPLPFLKSDAYGHRFAFSARPLGASTSF